MSSKRDRVASELVTFAGFLRGLPHFLRQRITPEQARAVILQRVRDRETNFIAALERGVFGNPRSPYRVLMALAGCELGDLKRQVETDGVEPTLRSLRDAGVYLSFEEFKGQRPIERGGRTIPARPEDFDNPSFSKYYHITTGGSTGRARRVLMDLEYLAARLPLGLISDQITGTYHVPMAIWFETPPGTGLQSMLARVPTDNVPERWFTPIRGGLDGTSLRFRLATRAVLTVARLAGVRIPGPEYLPLDRARVIAQWARDALRRRGACAMRGPVSRMVRVAIAAREEGIDLSGAVVVGGGEPPTPAKVSQITSTGARFISNYHFTEAGPVGMCCTTSSDPNDQHFIKDHLALIQSDKRLPHFGITVPAFYFTTLLPSAPKLLLNVESDDYGVVETRSCGCPWESLGFTDHIREIRSFRKLTGEGVTLIGSDMERVLEEVLPSRFGGTPLDYQLMEEEDERGFTRLTVLVSPSVPLASEAAVVETVLKALRQSGAVGDLSSAIWRQAGALRVRREAPRLTSRGKLMPLQIGRVGSRSPAQAAAAGTGRTT